jgi:hypothetical protein
MAGFQVIIYGRFWVITEVKTNAEQFKIDERPYLINEYIRIAKKPAIGEKLAGEVLWKNTGRTPALKVHVFIRIDVLERDPCCPADWASTAKHAHSSLEIGSNLSRSTPVEGDNPLSKQWFDPIIGGSSKIYIFGALVYHDIFGDSHESDFCAFYTPNSISELFLWATENGNDTK